MSLDCNGVNVVERKRSLSSESSLGDLSSGKDPPKGPPPEIEFKRYFPVPHVRLERYDISPYLNGHKKPRKSKEISREIDDEHQKRLSQKCVVFLCQDNLEELKTSFRRSESPSNTTLSYDSDTNSSQSAMKCKICDKSYSSEKKLLNHQQNKHIIFKNDKKLPKRVSFSDKVIIHEVKEYHKCRKCPKIFEEYHLLRSHMKNEHKKRKCYICNYCNKNFVDRMFFKVHIRLHCDTCGDLFPNKTKYTDHRRNVCRVLKTHKCKTCNLNFFKIMDLKDHMYEHNNFLYVCDVCKDNFSNKCEIAHHISFLHSKRRPKELYFMRKMGTERLYLCNFCDISSVEREIVENHVQKLPDLMNKATTGYKDYYFCDHCMNKFDTEKDMLQHKWTHFLKTATTPILKSILMKRPIKSKYLATDKIPQSMLPVIKLEKLEIPASKVVNGSIEAIYDINDALQTVDVNTLKKALVDQKRKKTLLSRHQCQTCDKYFSSNYCLNRHIATQHDDFENLRCKVCEETFVWPSLLRSHKCIRLNRPEMPFDDARPEIHFDNTPNFDDLNIGDSEDYMHSVDFEIPAPIVELKEYDVYSQSDNGSTGYRVVMQEVPIEF